MSVTPAADHLSPPVATSPRLRDPAGGGFGLKEVVDVLRRRRWLVIWVTVLGTAAAGGAGFVLSHSYTAQALVQLDPPAGQVTLQAAAIETQVNVIKSRDRLVRTVTTLNLLADPELNPLLRPETWPTATIGQLSNRLATWLPNRWLTTSGLADELLAEQRAGAAPTASVAPAAGAAPRSVEDVVIDNFNSRFKAYQQGRSFVIAFTYTSSDPAKAALIVNTAASGFIADVAAAKSIETARVSKWLDERLRGLRTELQGAERAVQNFRVSHNLVDAKGSPLKEQELADLNRELVTARAELVAKQARLDLVRHRGERLDSIPEVYNSPLIISLREQEAALLGTEGDLRHLYGDKHPKIRDLILQKITLENKIQSEIERIIHNFENEVQIAAARVASLDQEVAGLSSEVTSDHTLDVQAVGLEREAQTTRELYESFLHRFEQTREEEIAAPDVRIASKAAPPEQPNMPGPAIFAALGFTTSLPLSLLLALLRERLDSKLRGAGDLRRELDLATLSLVPQLGRIARGKRPHQYLMARPLSVYTEAIRSTYESLQLVDTGASPKVVLITSSVSGEGKTTLAVSLATFAAYSGRKVALVDLDLRHPSVQRELGTKPLTGLVEYLTGESKLDEMICHDASGVDYLPVRRLSPNPTALLGSPAMRRLVDELRHRYEIVILDTAPTLALTDSKVAARLADKIVFAVRWGKMDAETVRSCLLELSEAGVQITGAVLTQVNQRKQMSYGRGANRHYYSMQRKYFVD